jgi:predicted nuclease with TOPRIM domain
MIDKDTLESERMKLQSDFEAVQEQIRNTEVTLNSLRNNLNALHGAIQQTDKLLKLVDEKKESKSGKVVQKS